MRVACQGTERLGTSPASEGHPFQGGGGLGVRYIPGGRRPPGVERHGRRKMGIEIGEDENNGLMVDLSTSIFLFRSLWSIRTIA